tara:strand:- start:948 stop:1250 length:303 start_codon:yes stop_codon:yes gene_type:complete
MNIQNSESCPDYISKFIHLNMEKLCEIYDEGKYLNNIGLLLFKCSKEENKMDVQFKSDIDLENIYPQEFTNYLKNNYYNEDKKLFIINDIDINSIFILEY